MANFKNRNEGFMVSCWHRIRKVIAREGLLQHMEAVTGESYVEPALRVQVVVLAIYQSVWNVQPPHETITIIEHDLHDRCTRLRVVEACQRAPINHVEPQDEEEQVENGTGHRDYMIELLNLESSMNPLL